MNLVLSLFLALIPLLGILWILFFGAVTTVDGLFMSLILAAMSGILALNALLELKARMHPSGGAPSRTGLPRVVERGRVASVQFYEAHVGQANKSIVTLEDGARASHLLVLEGDVRNALPVGQKVEITLRRQGDANVLVNVNYA